ncbi:MAG: hypothetical protein JWL66_1845 [Sphingomonadales bacterium]|nr:hypothetical protein [Sphingomonadales bacterium]
MRYPVLLAPLVLLAAYGSHAEAANEGPRNFPVPGFSAVELAGSDNVHVARGNQVRVTATGPSEVLDRLDIHVEGDRLKISRKRSGWHMGWSSSRGAVITVITPGISAATLAGSGNMLVDYVGGTAFRGNVAGSGKLLLANVRVPTLTLDLAGSGDLSAAGVTRDVSLSIGGSGNIRAANLTGQVARISLSGSGNAQVGARVRAAISIAGSGNVTVKGTTNCQISKVGSGDARCVP